MTKHWRTVGIGVLLGTLVGVAVARADITGSSEGQITGKKVLQPIDVAATFSLSGKIVSGTLAVGGDGFAGAYLMHGKATPKTIKVTGILNGVSVKWNGKIAGDTAQGKIKFKKPGGKLLGALALTKNPPVADGSSCDAVFNANQILFTDQVLGVALVACTACHVPGGQADATRFHVNLNDALATARAVVPFVDAANPDASRVVEKPLALVPHGGGQQILPGSNEDTILRNWVALVAAAACN